MGTKAKKSVYRYKNSVNMLNCITYKSVKSSKVTSEDTKLPGTPYVAKGTTKEERFKDLPFSKIHHILVNATYGKENTLVKRDALIAKHEAHIRKVIAMIKAQKCAKVKAKNAKATTVMEIWCNNSKDEGYCFYTDYSNKSEKNIAKHASSIRDTLSAKWDSFNSIKVYSKINYVPGVPYTAPKVSYTLEKRKINIPNAA